ncbi:VOC family protein [Xylanimonas cellulosilytica]|nr:VOC family protein [Xylanimonas cellulosilytica]
MATTPLVAFKDLCIDANDAASLGAFYARTLGLRVETFDDGPDVALRGERPEQTVWINTVPEPKTVKHRVHLDVRARSLDEFPDAPRVSEPGRFRWTTLADPEGGELCVFEYDDVPAYRLKDVVVDCADPGVVGRFWHRLLGGELGHDAAGGDYWLDGGAGVPFESIDFVPVPEPKTLKNRIHWDVTLADGVTLADLVALGATVQREPDDEIRWTIMQDPEGNEFCAFPATGG